MKVLIVSAGYVPGFRFGGPVQSLSALVDQLGDEIEFVVVTSDRDLGESEPYPGIDRDVWTRVGKARVMYASSGRWSPLFWKRIVADERPDVIYLNSFFSRDSISVRLWHRLRLLGTAPVLLAPRGEFSPGALGIKRRKKDLFMRLSVALGLQDGLFWQASATKEREEIRSKVRAGSGDILMAPPVQAQRQERHGEQSKPSIGNLGDNTSGEVSIGGNFMAPDLMPETTRRTKPLLKQAGEARFVFVGRVARKKNLAGAIDLLASTEGTAMLTIIGPIEDPAYWQQCQDAISQLPSSVLVHYGGELAHEDVDPELSNHHFLLFPTLGENFGHTIAEALNQGLPVLISDRTPWEDLEAAGVGWDIDLDDIARWKNVLQRCVDMNDPEYQAMSGRCLGYVDRWMAEYGGREASLRMFRIVAMSR